MSQPVVLSASSVTTYQTCRLKWYFEYVAAIESEKSEKSEPMLTGIAVHEAAELYLKGTVTKDSVVHTDPVLLPLERLFRDEILPTYEEVVAVEQEFQITVNGIPYAGTIDAIDRWTRYWGKEVVIRDLKTTGSKPRYGGYRFAMCGYYLGAQSLGYDPCGMRLDYIVRTKKPYYLPEDFPVPTKYEILGFTISVETAAENIAVGSYQPTGLGTSACSWCGFKSVCGPYQRYADATSPKRKEQSNG